MIWYKYLALFVAACTAIPAAGIFFVEAARRLDCKPAEHNMATQLVIIAAMGVMLGMAFHGVEW